MNQVTPTIVLTGGGSGGHITPLLSLAHEIKHQNPDCQIIYIGHKGDDFDSLKDKTNDFDFLVFINAGKFRRYHGQSVLAHLLDVKTLGLNLRDLVRLPSSVFTSVRALRRFKAQVVFSKGGFVALPVGIAAKLLRIPIVTHDSDVLPGLTNKIIGRWAKVHATGMPAKYYSYPRGSVVHVGIPINGAIKKVTPKIQKEYKQKLKFPEESKILLVAGGGNGSKRLNDLTLAISRHLLESDLSLNIVHATGSMHETLVKETYAQQLPKTEQSRVRVQGFIANFNEYVAAADVVITRAGATTLAELAAAGKACIIIPSPFLTSGHQLKNAHELEKLDGAVVAEENIEPDELLVIVSELLKNDHRRFELAKNLYGTFAPDAAAKLASIILKTAEQKGRS